VAYVPDDLQYTKDHEWVKVTGDGQARIGITDYAQKQLGDIVYVDLPAEGAKLTRGAPLGFVESVKSVSEIYTPVSGVVTSLNGELGDSPELVNTDPYDDGWMFEIRLGDKNELKDLLSRSQYESHIRDAD
jgi:glycine cleavage system H protein